MLRQLNRAFCRKCRKTIQSTFCGPGNEGALVISIHLRNRVMHSYQIATRRFGSATGRVAGKFCLVQPEQQGALLPQTFNRSKIELFFRLHTLLYRFSERLVSRPRTMTRSQKCTAADGVTQQLAVFYGCRLTTVTQKPSIVIERATFSYSFRFSELSQPI